MKRTLRTAGMWLVNLLMVYVLLYLVFYRWFETISFSEAGQPVYEVAILLSLIIWIVTTVIDALLVKPSTGKLFVVILSWLIQIAVAGIILIILFWSKQITFNDDFWKTWFVMSLAFGRCKSDLIGWGWK